MEIHKNMTQEEKANRYDSLVREGDIVQREMSKLKSTNLGFNQSTEYDNKLNELKNKLIYLEGEIKKLF